MISFIRTVQSLWNIDLLAVSNHGLPMLCITPLDLLLRDLTVFTYLPNEEVEKRRILHTNAVAFHSILDWLVDSGIDIELSCFAEGRYISSGLESI
jgi:hypothetical protein